MNRHKVWISTDYEIPDFRDTTQQYQREQYRAKTVTLTVELGDAWSHVGLSGTSQRLKKDGTDSGHAPRNEYSAWSFVTPREFEDLWVEVIKVARDLLSPKHVQRVDAALAKEAEKRFTEVNA